MIGSAVGGHQNVYFRWPLINPHNKAGSLDLSQLSRKQGGTGAVSVIHLGLFDTPSSELSSIGDKYCDEFRGLGVRYFWGGEN